MVGIEQLLRLDAVAQAALVRRGEVSARELVEASMDRIERLDGSVNAVVTREFDRASEAAAGPLPDGPFTGVPFLLKDMLSGWTGVRMTWGSRLAGAVNATANSELVERLERAGLILMGKTNTSELGLLPTCEPARFGATANPWDLDRSSGGSSGGSAAAVATGMVPMAQASDGGGSIRIPASCCGLFGLKPTRGRNPMGPDLGDVLGGLVVEHALTRSVRDSAVLLDATAGPDAGAPYWAAPPAQPFAEQLGRAPGSLRIAFTTETPLGGAMCAECASAVRDAAALCETLGHNVTEGAPDYDHEQAVEIFSGIWAAGCANLVDGIARRCGRDPLPGLLEPVTRDLYQRGRELRATDYLRYLHGMQSLARRIAGFFDEYDLYLTPTLAALPPPLGHFDPNPREPAQVFQRAADLVLYTPIANMTGQPAMSVPLHWSKDGLPVGVHFTGRYGEEATLFRFAAQLEEARPWRDRWPEWA
jgi:amidase